MGSYYAVTWHPGQQMAALRLATQMRRVGISTDYALQGKPQRQFDKAKDSGAAVIITIRGANDARIWWRWRKGVDCLPSEALAYALWLEDDTDQLPEPPPYLLEQSNG